MGFDKLDARKGWAEGRRLTGIRTEDVLNVFGRFYKVLHFLHKAVVGNLAGDHLGVLL